MPESIYTHIARESARKIWQLGGKILGHGVLALSAYKLFGATTEAAPANEGLFGRLRRKVLGSENEPTVFSRWGKKLFGWGAAEAIAAHKPVKESMEYTWHRLEPTAVKFLTPIVQTVEEPVLKHLSEEGYIRLHGNWAQAVAAQYIPDFKGTWVESLNLWLGEWKSNVHILQAQNTVDRALAVAEKHAPIAGKAVADSMKSAYDYGSRFAAMPRNLITAAEELIDVYQIPPIGILGLGVGIGAVGMLGYYGLWRNQMTQIQHQQATGNNVVINLSPSSSKATPPETPRKG